MRCICIILGMVFSAQSYGREIVESYLMAPLSCQDIMRRAMPVAPDLDVDRIKNYCYVLCTQIRILQDQVKNAQSQEEKQALSKNIQFLEKLVSTALIALRVAYFVFGPMKFRAFLCEKQLKRGENLSF